MNHPDFPFNIGWRSRGMTPPETLQCILDLPGINGVRISKARGPSHNWIYTIICECEGDNDGQVDAADATLEAALTTLVDRLKDEGFPAWWVRL